MNLQAHVCVCVCVYVCSCGVHRALQRVFCDTRYEIVVVSTIAVFVRLQLRDMREQG